MPKTKEQFDAMKMASIENIRDAGVKLFAKKGLAGTSINEIAKEAGISIGLMYHYYKSKEELYIELVKFALTTANELLKQLLETKDMSPGKKIETFTKNMLDGLNNDGDSAPYYFALIDQSLLSNNIYKITGTDESLVFESYHTLQLIIREGQRTGDIKNGDARSLTTLYLSAIHGLCFFKLTTGDYFSLPESSWINEILINKQQILWKRKK
ncbi:MAG: TetR/AcrR family transcriptional regulator [Bacteroidales bacterium]|jgi:AcrR family transcriptional regulator|nr:TetR/AcrR family transcriptional regulator [Bacteroidales bacterium]